MEQRRCLMLMYSEIRRNKNLAAVASTPWQRSYYLEVAEAMTIAANAVCGRRGGAWSRLVARCGLCLHGARTRMTGRGGE